MGRYERKFRIEGMDFAEVLQVVRGLPLSFRTLFPDRQINNIYLDTPDYQFFQDNLIGADQRKKYRIRWYGALNSKIEKPVLEEKIRDNEIGDKVLHPMSPLEGYSHATVNAALRKEIMIDFPLEAKLINSYQRSYFASYDRKFRLTIDRDLRFHPVPLQNDYLAPAMRDEAIIVEIKYDFETDPEWDRVGRTIPFRLSKNSKYVNGLLLAGLI